jgi:hypothetical protein
MPLLMHADNIDWADILHEWTKDPANKAVSKAGDDRTPAWRWIGYLNHDDPKTGVVTIPSEYIMRCIMGGAAEVQTGKGRKTFKVQSQSGILCERFHWPLLIKGKPIQMSDITPLLSVNVFKEHVETVRSLGFELFVKRVVIGNNKHIRVRPRFENWSCAGELIIIDDQITDTVLTNIVDIAGRLKGLGNWRPSAKTPGPFGTFTASVNGK